MNNGFFYATNQSSSTITKCTQESTGALAQCITAANSLTQPHALAMSNNFLYVSLATTNEVYKCTVDTGDGTLSSCTSTGSGFSRPVGIEINHTYAYIVNQTADTVSICDVHATTGVLSNCSSSGATALDEPGNITIY